MSLPLQRISHHQEPSVCMKRLVQLLLLRSFRISKLVFLLQPSVSEGFVCRWSACVKQGSLKEVLWIMPLFVGK